MEGHSFCEYILWTAILFLFRMDQSETVSFALVMTVNNAWTTNITVFSLDNFSNCVVKSMVVCVRYAVGSWRSCWDPKTFWFIVSVFWQMSHNETSFITDPRIFNQKYFKNILPQALASARCQSFRVACKSCRSFTLELSVEMDSPYWY